MFSFDAKKIEIISVTVKKLIEVCYITLVNAYTLLYGNSNLLFLDSGCTVILKQDRVMFLVTF